MNREARRAAWKPAEFAVVAIALLIAVNHLVAAYLLSSAEEYSEQLNLAGAQRMLSQRSLLLAQDYAGAPTSAGAAALRETVARTRREHTALRDGAILERGDGPVEVSPVTGVAGSMIRGFSGPLLEYLDAIERALDEPSRPLPDIATASALLDDANAIVVELERTSVADNRRLLGMHIGVGLFEVAVLMFVVFRFVRRARLRSDRKRSQLESRAQLLLTLYDESPLIQYSVDSRWRLTRVNKAWLDALGYTEEEAIGRRSRNFITPGSFAELAPTVDSFLELFDADGLASDLPLTLRASDGGSRECSVSIRLHRNADGEFVGADFVCLDVTESKESRRKLDNATRALADSFRNMPIPMFHWQPGTGVIRANLAMLSAFGVASVAALRTPELEAVMTRVLARMPSADETAVVRNLKEEIAIPGGEALAVLISLRASTRSDHEAGVIEGALIDITELERIKGLVKRSRHRFRQLYDATPVMLYSLDERGCIQDVNDHMLVQLGRERHDLIGRDSAELVPEGARAEATKQLTQTLRRGERATLDCEIAGGGGQTIQGRLVASPKLDKDGVYSGAFVCILDMTDVVVANAERDRIAEELQTAQKLEAVGQLAAGIAHEINTPAQYVADNLQFVSQAFGELLAYIAAGEDAGTADKAAAAKVDVGFLRLEVPNALTEAADGMQQIKRIVLAMKDFSHPGGDQHEPVDLNRLIESVATVTRNEWKYVAKLTTSLAPDLPRLVCSGSALNQVLLNMVVNASHALEGVEDGEIRIGTAEIDGHVRITIADNGCGIAADQLSKIFNPFFTTKDVGKGTGQGLAIAYRIVKEHHGRIDVDSAVGEGTTFTISLPLTIPEESTEDAA